LTTEFFNFGRKKPENSSQKNGNFLIISGHFIANYINIFHKTEIQMVILRCLLCLNLNWVKSYDIFWFFNFERKKPENLSLKNGHFLMISGHFIANYINIFHKTEIQMVILRCLLCLNLNWVKSYDIFWLKYLFFHAWKSIILVIKYQSKFWYLRRNPAVMFSRWVTLLCTRDQSCLWDYP
jgi:hypothetical protein